MKKTVAVVILLGISYAHAETPLARLFNDMRNPDPKVQEIVQNTANDIINKEMPTIEQDTALLCSALLDTNTHIRLQAAGLMQVIVLTAPQHVGVINACVQPLIAAAGDHGEVEMTNVTVDNIHEKIESDERVFAREDALFALAMRPGGPHPMAQMAFVGSLNSPIYRISQLGIAGMLKMTGPNQHSNQLQIHTKLATSNDPKERLNILYAIAGAGTPVQWFYDDAHRILLDSSSDPELQQAAIKAMAVTATDKAALLTTMQLVKDSPSVYPKTVQMEAQGVIAGLTARP